MPLLRKNSEFYPRSPKNRHHGTIPVAINEISVFFLLKEIVIVLKINIIELLADNLLLKKRIDARRG